MRGLNRLLLHIWEIIMKPIQVGRLNTLLLDLWGPKFKLGTLAIQVVLNGSPKFVSFSKRSSSSQAVCDRVASHCFTNYGKPASIILEKARFVCSVETIWGVGNEAINTSSNHSNNRWLNEYVINYSGLKNLTL